MDLDKFKDVDLVIDHADSNTFIPKKFVSVGDVKGRTLTVQITNNGVVGALPGVAMTAVWTNKASGITDMSAFELIDAGNSIFRLTYPSHMLTAGKVEMTLQVLYSGQTTTLKTFEITVQAVNGNFTALIESQQFSALTQALSKVNSFTNNSPQEVFATLDQLVAKYPSGTKGAMIVASTGKWYWWDGTQWAEGGVYQAVNVSDSETQRIVTMAIDNDNWVKNSDFKSTSYVPVQTSGGTGALFSYPDTPDENWFKFVGDSTTNEKSVNIPLVIAGTKKYFGGYGEIDVRKDSANNDKLDLFLQLGGTTYERIYLKTVDIYAYNNHKILFSIPSTNDKTFDWAGLLLVPKSQDQSVYMVKKPVIKILYSFVRGRDENPIAQANISYAVDYGNWIKNAKMTTNYQETPYLPVGDVTRNFSGNTTRRWTSFVGTTPDKKGAKIQLEVEKDSDRFWFTANFECTLRNQYTTINDFEIDLVVVKKDGTEQVVNLSETRLISNWNLNWKLSIPSIVSLGIDYADIVDSYLFIYSKDYTKTNFTIGNAEIITSPSKIQDETTKFVNKLPRLDLFGDDTTWSDVSMIKSMFKFRFSDHTRVVSGYSETSIQGDSSLYWPKKNLRLKLYKDLGKNEKLNLTFGATSIPSNKFNLKANYTDRWHARHLTSAKIAKQMFYERDKLPTDIADFKNGGQIKGYPCLMYLNNTFYGLMTLNSTKDDVTTFKDETKSIVIGGNNTSTGNKWEKNEVTVDPKLYGADFSLEFPDKMTTNIQTNVNRLATFINSASDQDFMANIDSYIDLNSVIDWLLLLDVTGNTDMINKNVLYATKDGLKWYVIPYDHDVTWGADWRGQSEADINARIINQNVANKLLRRIIKLYPNEIKSRFNTLKARNVLTVKNIQNEFGVMVDSVGQEAYELDREQWAGVNNAYNILDYERTMQLIRKRMDITEQDILDI